MFAARYQIKRRIGEGHRKVVYLARDVMMYRDVALAVLKSDTWESAPEAAEHEMRVLGTVGRHDNIVTPYDVGSSGSEHYMVFEYFPGGTLHSYLQDLETRSRKMTGDEILRLARQLCRGLSHLHGCGVIHRDLCPKNIWLDERLAAHIGDVDTAILVDIGSAILRPLSNQNYAAPEEVKGGRLDQRCDLFSLGAVLFSAAMGSEKAPREPRRLATARPDLPGSFRNLLSRLLADGPEHRPPDAQSVLKSLELVRAELALLRPARQSPDVDLPEPDPAELRLPSQAETRPYAIGDVIDGRFEVLDFVAEGGFSHVYRVHDTVENEERAIKLFNNVAGYEAVRREIGALRKVRHPRVIEVFWADKADSGEWYLVTEFVDGESLSDYAHGKGQLRDREAVDVVLDVLEAVIAIHPDVTRIEHLKERGAQGPGLSEAEFLELQELQENGLVHRDIKPSNIILTRTGAKLLDFNIASRVGEPVKTQTSTPAYQAPDMQLTRWDTSTDLFAVGVVLYELLCGRHPYPGGMPMLDQQVISPRLLRKDLPPSLVEFLVKACAAERSERFTSATAMREELRQIRASV